jgi:hypothetical protein
MNTTKRLIAGTELLLVSPAVLFLTALFVRGLRPLQYEPSHTAHQIAMWYAGRQWTLWALLILLPLVVLVTGSATLLRGRHDQAAPRQPLATSFIAAATLTAGAILVRVALHFLVR